MTGTTTRIPLRRLVGRYQLVDPIADGGMGSVWRVWDAELGGYVAAKLLRPADAGSLLRFVREQSLRVVHPHVAAPTGWAAEDDQVLLTMDLVRGGSVAQLLGDYGPLYLSYAVVLMDQLFDALDAVHGRGVVHRDVKPSNLLLEPTGRDRPVLRLADFGIAAVVGEPRLTQPDLMVGSPGYMAPECARGAAPEVRQDLYSAGVVAVELLTGETGTGPLPESLPDVPQPVAEVLRALLARSPGDRPDTAGTARQAWRAAVERAGVPPVDPGRPDAIEVFDHVGPLPDGFGPSGPIAAGGLPAIRVPVAGAAAAGPAPGVPRPTPNTPVPIPVGVPGIGGSGRMPGAAGMAPHGPGDPAGDGVPDSLLRLHIRERLARRTMAVLGASALALVVVLAVVLATSGHDATGERVAPAVSVGVSEDPAVAGAVNTTPSPSSVLPSSQPSHQPSRQPATTVPQDGHPSGTATRAPAPLPSSEPIPASSPVSICTPGGCAAHAYFVADGDHLFVCDDAKDGYGAIAQYTRTDVPGQNNDARNTGGNGTCLDHNMNMPEGSTITFRVCLLSGSGAISTCSARITTTA